MYFYVRFPVSHRDLEEIVTLVRQAHRYGFALAVNKFAQGEIGIAVAVTNRHGLPLGAIHVAGSLSEWTPKAFVGQAVPVTFEAARAINGNL